MSSRTRIFDDFELTENERIFIDKIDDANSLGVTSFQINVALSEIYAAKVTERTSKEVAKSLDELNKQLENSSVSSEKSSNRMFWLTVALFFVGAVQAVVALLSVMK